MQSPETRSPSPSSYHTDPLLVVSSYLYQRRSIICYRRATCFVSNWIAVAAGFAQVGAKYPHVEHCEDESRGTCKCLFKATRRACLELSRYSQAHIPDTFAQQFKGPSICYYSYNTAQICQRSSKLSRCPDTPTYSRPTSPLRALQPSSPKRSDHDNGASPLVSSLCFLHHKFNSSVRRSR